MSLTLAIINKDKLDNGEPTTIKLNRHGLTIGRSSLVDWSLPDPQHYISSSHCEIKYKDGGYTLVDTSTNGTFVNGGQAPVQGAHALSDKDVLLIGPYEIQVSLGDGASSQAPPRTEEPFTWGMGAQSPPAAPSAWDAPAAAAPARPAQAPPAASAGGWDPAPSAAPTTPAAPAASAGWDAPAPAPGASGSGWSSPPSAPAAAPAASGWAVAAEPPGLAASAWSDSGAVSSKPAAVDIWGSMAEANSVDWGRGLESAPPAADTFAFSAPSVGAASGPAATPSSDPVARSPGRAADPAPGPDAGWRGFVAALGLQPSDLTADQAQAMAGAGAVLRRLVGGMIVLMEARARAKAQMGAQGTILEFSGNNPLKFARSPEQAVAQLINPPVRGFMTSEAAVDDAFKDLQAHQMATLAAMQGALAATLKRFSPDAIRSRAEMRGVLAKILPAARDATLWQAYEREFEGVAKGSDEAFMDVFAKEFRRAYEAAAGSMKSKA